MSLSIHIIPHKIFFALCITIACLTFLNIINFVYFNNPNLSGRGNWILQDFMNLFNMNRELSLPTYFSQTILLASAIILWIIAAIRKQSKLPYLAWTVLGFIFLFLSIDEGVEFHEKFTRITYLFINGTDYLYFAWVVPYGILVTIFGLAYLKFLINLPRKTAILFVVSGTIFIAGAIGIEMISANHADHHTGHNITFYTMYTYEEFLEMLGISLFIYALLAYIKEELKEVKAHIRFL